MNTADKDALHAAIMNLPCRSPDSCMTQSDDLAYKQGHRDARHAAAELVSASLVAPQEVRMLTEQEIFNSLVMPGVAGSFIGTTHLQMTLGEFNKWAVNAQRKFASVNGLSIKEQAVKPATDKEMPNG